VLGTRPQYLERQTT